MTHATFQFNKTHLLTSDISKFDMKHKLTQ